MDSQSKRPVPLGSGMGLAAVYGSSIGNEAGDRLAMASDDNFLSMVDEIEQGSQGIFCFEGTNFTHRRPLKLA